MDRSTRNDFREMHRTNTATSGLQPRSSRPSDPVQAMMASIVLRSKNAAFSSCAVRGNARFADQGSPAYVHILPLPNREDRATVCSPLPGPLSP